MLRKKLGKQHASQVTNNIKYLPVTLTKQVKDLYDRNVKLILAPVAMQPSLPGAQGTPEWGIT